MENGQSEVSGEVAGQVEVAGEVGTEIPVAVVEGEAGTVAGAETSATEKEPRPRTTDVQFATAWEKSNSKDEVATALKLSLQSVEQRATKLRKAGWPLKTFPRKQAEKADGFAVIAGLRGLTVEQLKAEIAAKEAAKAPKPEAPAA